MGISLHILNNIVHKKMIPNEKLDAVLRCLNQFSIDMGNSNEISVDGNRKDLKTSAEIGSTLVLQNIEIKNFELNLILFHLAQEEKYILEDVKYYGGSKDNVPSFRILYAGKLFIEDNGYQGKFKRLKRENRRKFIVDVALMAAGIGAMVTAILLLSDKLIALCHWIQCTFFGCA